MPVRLLRCPLGQPAHPQQISQVRDVSQELHLVRETEAGSLGPEPLPLGTGTDDPAGDGPVHPFEMGDYLQEQVHPLVPYQTTDRDDVNRRLALSTHWIASRSTPLGAAATSLPGPINCRIRSAVGSDVATIASGRRMAMHSAA